MKLQLFIEERQEPTQRQSRNKLEHDKELWTRADWRKLWTEGEERDGDNRTKHVPGPKLTSSWMPP